MKKPKLKLHKILKRKKLSAGQPANASGEGVPRITNDTVAAHREEVIGSARKYIYPLQHSKHRIVLISTGLVIAAIVTFFTYCTVALYKTASNTTFLYRVTQVIPFPVARAGNQFVAYENYLFELRHYIHYYETQAKRDFNDPNNKDQLNEFKKRALDKVVNDAYTKQLAKKNDVTISDKEVDDEINVVRTQNRLGNSDKVFEDVLKDYWGWSLGDFKRSLRSEMLAQKLVSSLDTATHARADGALAELKGGADFKALAKKYSDEQETKNNGGDYGYAIDKTNRNLSAKVTDALFKLPTGQHSDVLNTGYTLEIVKNVEITGDKVKAAHIVFNFKEINSYINDQKDKQKARLYIKIK